MVRAEYRAAPIDTSKKLATSALCESTKRTKLFMCVSPSAGPARGHVSNQCDLVMHQAHDLPSRHGSSRLGEQERHVVRARAEAFERSRQWIVLVQTERHEDV